jgi:hypothetical protein
MQCSCASISRNRRCPGTEQRGGNDHSGRSRCSCSISTGLSQRTPSSAVLVALKRPPPIGGGWLRGPIPAITCELLRRFRSTFPPLPAHRLKGLHHLPHACQSRENIAHLENIVTYISHPSVTGSRTLPANRSTQRSVGEVHRP